MQSTSGREKLKTLLLDELASRQARNAAYSLRAFARDIEVNVTSLSEFFAGKRDLSKRTVKRVTEKLQLSPLMSDSILQGLTQNREDLILDEEMFHALSEWYYYAILNLARLPKTNAAPEWIASRLGISPVMARSARDRLLRLGLIRIERGRLVRTSANLTTRNDRPSTALRRYHRQNLQLAEKSLEGEPLHRRFITSVTMPTNPQKMNEATQLILKFRDEMARLLETGPTSEVYTLALQLFPLTKRRTDA